MEKVGFSKPRPMMIKNIFTLWVGGTAVKADVRQVRGHQIDDVVSQSHWLVPVSNGVVVSESSEVLLTLYEFESEGEVEASQNLEPLMLS